MAGVEKIDGDYVVAEHRKCWQKCNIGRIDRENMTCIHFEEAKQLAERDGTTAICPKFKISFKKLKK
jgi:hypothetical protein